MPFIPSENMQPQNEITTRQFNDLLQLYRAAGEALEWEPLTDTASVMDFCYFDEILERWDFISISTSPAQLPTLRARLKAVGVKFDLSAMEDMTDDDKYNEMVDYGQGRPYFFNDKEGQLASVVLGHRRAI